MAERIEADVTIVGAGIAGLWTAKELIDQGLSVTIIEKSVTLADGATTRNEGWLHAGTYHSVGIENDAEAIAVTAAIRSSHETIMDFAPEIIDHEPSFALVASDELAHKAVARWGKTGISYQEVAKDTQCEAEGIASERLCAMFRVEDKSINSRMLCQKLACYVFERGARIFTGTAFTPESDTTARAQVHGNNNYDLRSDRFVITAGNGIQGVVKDITGKPWEGRFFKAHLLMLPRLTHHNYFHIDAGESGYMNHGDLSVVAVNRDGIELLTPDYLTDPDKEQLAYSALVRMLPFVQKYELGSSIQTIVCNKPDALDDTNSIQSLDVKIFEPAPSYICALPGKMTMAPYLAHKLLEILMEDAANHGSTCRSENVSQQFSGKVTLRPVDNWNNAQGSFTHAW